MLQKNVEGNISMTKVIEDLKKKKKNPNGSSRGEKHNGWGEKYVWSEKYMLEVNNRKKKILHKKNQDSFLEDTTIGTIQMRQRRKITQ